MTRARNAYRLSSFWLSGRRPPAAAPPSAAAARADSPSPPASPGELRHGYTLADLHGLARLAVHTARAMASDWHERYDTAWSAIAEALYAAEEPPRRGDLVAAGQAAIHAVVDAYYHHHGVYRRRTTGGAAGPGSSPRFVTYWDGLVRAAPSCESRVVERLSLWAILPTLTGRQREAITALAVYDDYGRAAAALGMPQSTFKSYVAGGRNRFLKLWHEGEVPSRAWGCDRRAGRTADEQRAGGGRSTMETVRRRARRERLSG